jgi:hypothetical protein
VPKRIVATADGVRQAGSELRTLTEVIAQMRKAKCDMASFIQGRQSSDRSSDRIWRKPFDEPQEREKRPFTKHRQQK